MTENVIDFQTIFYAKSDTVTLNKGMKYYDASCVR